MALLAKVGRTAAEWRSRVNAAAVFLPVEGAGAWRLAIGYGVSQGIFIETTPEEKCNL